MGVRNKNSEIVWMYMISPIPSYLVFCGCVPVFVFLLATLKMKKICRLELYYRKRENIEGHIQNLLVTLPSLSLFVPHTVTMLVKALITNFQLSKHNCRLIKSLFFQF